ncbi:hypothetical protein R3P38DRAFT_1842643 [Favolaschia claudopus]|uniref:F-box domain-containing protein n=1 Tax=Favolaschia claudopus TaxID=2862362 RepID=A0AAW0A1Y7_9AGAR
MAAPGLPLPELWDHIIGFIPPTPTLTPTLKHLALVCRTFAHPAQRSLFRSIFIEDGQKIEYERIDLVVDRRAITGGVVAGYLADLLASSPHLLPFIRELKVQSAHAQCYHTLSTIPWVNLRSLHFKNIFCFPSAAGSAVEALVSMSSLRRLEISVYSGTLPDRRTAEWMQRILLSCSPHVEFLVLEGVYLDTAELSQGTNEHTASRCRPRLRELSLTHCQGISGLLLHAFDFTASSLRMVQCSDAYDPDIVPFMRQIGSCVEHLVVSSLGMLMSLEFANRIRCHFSQIPVLNSWIWQPSFLRSLPSPHLLRRVYQSLPVTFLVVSTCIHLHPRSTPCSGAHPQITRYCIISTGCSHNG